MEDNIDKASDKKCCICGKQAEGKIAEQKALEAYPILFSERSGYDNTFKDRRESYIKGYNQAMQDFLEKALLFLDERLTDKTLENFKKYIKQ